MAKRIRLIVGWVLLTPETLLALTIGEVPLLSFVATPEGLKALVPMDREYIE